MNLEYWLLIISLIISTVVLLIVVPRKKIREAWVIFLFKQIVTWFIGLVVVEMRLIEYPVRFFPYANRTSFTFEYYIYPVACVVFNFKYPRNRSKGFQFLYYNLFATVLMIIEIPMERYTDAINYISWEWYYSYIGFLITFYLSRAFYHWFFKKV